VAEESSKQGTRAKLKRQTVQNNRKNNKNMKKSEDIALKLLQENQWEKSKIGRFVKWFIFLLGFSQCRHCLNCKFDGDVYRGFRESFLIRHGKCSFSGDSVSSALTYEELRKIHRCPGFISMLYNFKDYAISPVEIEKIRSIRSQRFFAWMGWFVALITAILSIIQMNR